MSSVTNEKRSLPLLVAITVGLFYAPSLTFGFVYDDAEIILNRPALRSWFEIGRLFLRPYYDGLPYYRPIPAAIFAIERLLFFRVAKDRQCIFESI